MVAASGGIPRWTASTTHGTQMLSSYQTNGIGQWFYSLNSAFLVVVGGHHVDGQGGHAAIFENGFGDHIISIEELLLVVVYLKVVLEMKKILKQPSKTNWNRTRFP